MSHRRSGPTHVPVRAFSFHSLARLSQLVEDRFRDVVAVFGPRHFLADPLSTSGTAEIRPAIPAALLKAEVEALPAEQHLVVSGQFSVYCARAEQFPWCL